MPADGHCQFLINWKNVCWMLLISFVNRDKRKRGTINNKYYKVDMHIIRTLHVTGHCLVCAAEDMEIWPRFFFCGDAYSAACDTLQASSIPLLLLFAHPCLAAKGVCVLLTWTYECFCSGADKTKQKRGREKWSLLNRGSRLLRWKMGASAQIFDRASRSAIDLHLIFRSIQML
jgi:hypothetical protein